jgi:hypothetical protein
MNTGKEPFKCGIRIAECGVRDQSTFISFVGVEVTRLILKI